MTSIKKKLSIAAAGLLAASLSWVWGSTSNNGKIVHIEPSQFGSVVVVEKKNARCLRFSEGIGLDQTCIDLDNPNKLVFDYARMAMSSLFVHPDPKSILVVGLGGGTLSTALKHVLPSSTVDTVELDPAVARVAERFFGYEKTDSQRLYIEDGRAFIEQALAKGQEYDMVLLDAYGENYIPMSLMTAEFLESVRGLLAPEGIVVANLFTSSPLYEEESATYSEVFGPFYNLRTSRGGNRIIIAKAQSLPNIEAIKVNAKNWSGILNTLGVNARSMFERFTLIDEPAQEWRVLRDEAISS